MLNIRRGDVLNDALSEAKKQKFYNDKHIKVFVYTLCINVCHALFKCVAWWNSLKPAKEFLCLRNMGTHDDVRWGNLILIT